VKAGSGYTWPYQTVLNSSLIVLLASLALWILRPGREIFVVFNQGWIRELDASGRVQYRAADRGVSAKMQYTLRF
jgi:hypothetical protein